MTPTLRVACVLAVLWAVPAWPQSANRSLPGPSGAPRPHVSRTVPAPEAEAVRHCRLHCGSLAASTPRGLLPPLSSVEKDARGKACARRMFEA
jgi:hypothetical protein